MSLALAGWSCFCLMFDTSTLSLTVGLTIGGVEFMGGGVAICFSK